MIPKRHKNVLEHTAHIGLVESVILGLIRFYQLTLSSVMGRNCRHWPSCSHYAAQAVRRHGAWRGVWLGLSRVARCNPLGSHGFDPVPETLPDHGWRFWRYGRWSARHMTENTDGDGQKDCAASGMDAIG